MKQTDDDDDGEASSKPDWKKKKVDDDERLTLRIDAIEADKYQARKNKMKTSLKRAKPNKNSKKVKQLCDDEDEDEYDDIEETVERSFRELRLNQNDASNNDTSLLDALLPHEKRMIEQQTTIAITRQQENAGKLNAIEQADTLARRAGIEKVTHTEQNEQMREAIYNPRRLRLQTLQKNVAKQTGIEGEIKPREQNKVVQGVKNVKQTTENHKVKNVKTTDVKTVAKTGASQNKTAEMILRKSGQTAKLTEIKKQIAYNLPPKQKAQRRNDAEKSATEQPGNTPEQKQGKRSYTEQVRKLLRESLRKNNKVRG